MRYIIYWLAFSIICTTSWICNYFGNLTVDQFIFHLQFIHPAEDTFPKNLVFLFVRNCIIYPFLLLALAFLIENIFIILCKVFSQKISAFNKLIITKKIIIYSIPILFLLLALIKAITTFSLCSYVTSKLMEADQLKKYVNPNNVNLKVYNPNNLILIYVESFEESYSNTNISNNNLLAELDSIKGIKFSYYKQLPGTGWTMAGVFATQCGTYIHSNFLNGKDLCLGDILSKHGYTSVFLQGSSLKYSKMGEFFKLHKYDELYGKEEWQNKGLNHMNPWGLYDDDLFNQAKIKLDYLYKKGKPFNLTILTVDTHCPNGYLSKYCKQEGAYNLNGIIKCTAKQINDCIHYVKENDYLKDTNIVIIGDHLYPLNNKFLDLTKTKRSIYNLFISKDLPVKNREEIVHFDLFPTILEFINIDIEGDKLGMGESAF